MNDAPFLTVNGHAIVIDAYGEAQSFLDRYYVDGGEIFKRHEMPKACVDPMNRSGDVSWLESPYPELPRCKINQLIWPSGASRYGQTARDR